MNTTDCLVFCADCKFSEKPIRISSVCFNPKFTRQDYVTGGMVCGDCYLLNKHGLCDGFQKEGDK